MADVPHILLAEDEESLQELIAYNLTEAGYKVTLATNGEEALKAFAPGRFHLVILDVMMPKIDGFEVCKAIREKDRETPVLFLTAKGFAADRVHGLKIGADDYLVKPFDLEEFLLRVEKWVARSQGKTQAPEKVQLGAAEVNFTAFEAARNGQQVDLPKKELELLKLLYDRRGEVVSRNDMLDTVWGADAFPTSRTVDNYILSLRKLVETDPKNPEIIQSVRGVGYKMKK